MRFLVVYKLTAGGSRNRAAHEIGVAVSTVVRTARRYLQCGIEGLFDQRRFNGMRKVDDIRNGSKSLGSISSGIGSPKLWTATMTRSLSSTILTATWDFPCSMALPTRFEITCAIRSASQWPSMDGKRSVWI
jgi:hypothetical protein